MKALAVAIVAVTFVVVFGLVTTGGAVTSKPLVAVQVDEFSVFPGTQGAPMGKVRFVVTNIGTVTHEFMNEWQMDLVRVGTDVPPLLAALVEETGYTSRATDYSEI